MPPTAQPRHTRGKSRPGRLRLLDRYLEAAEAPLLTRCDGSWAGAVCLDVGLGEQAHTTMEWAARLRRHHPNLRFLGIDNDPTRVHNAVTHHSTPGLDFALGGFAPTTAQPLRLVRALNLLRAYPTAEVPEAWAAMGAGLLPGGLLVEGGTDKQGVVLVAHLLRRQERRLSHEGLLFAVDGSRGFAPAMFRGVLPIRLRARPGPGDSTRAFLDRWTQAWEPTRELEDPLARLAASAAVLLEAGEPVEDDQALWARGLLRWRPAALEACFSLALPAPTP